MRQLVLVSVCWSLGAKELVTPPAQLHVKMLIADTMYLTRPWIHGLVMTGTMMRVDLKHIDRDKTQTRASSFPMEWMGIVWCAGCSLQDFVCWHFGAADVHALHSCQHQYECLAIGCIT